ncbi:hypothetical protein [Haladaptatus caseinilyticus]|uniref:hypothetical protein n=1 Tax=Haladaptatus caseinilyticus TaxID=2993314 RepID=UPI00224A5799|nr:hypothetical protein [Haladaptatus caseinilyticus]
MCAPENPLVESHWFFWFNGSGPESSHGRCSPEGRLSDEGAKGSMGRVWAVAVRWRLFGVGNSRRQE